MRRGPVSGTSSSYLGGFVGINLGLIQNSSTADRKCHRPRRQQCHRRICRGEFRFDRPVVRAAGNVTGGSGDLIGSFAGVNAHIHQSRTSSGRCPVIDLPGRDARSPPTLPRARSTAAAAPLVGASNPSVAAGGLSVDHQQLRCASAARFSRTGLLSLPSSPLPVAPASSSAPAAAGVIANLIATSPFTGSGHAGGVQQPKASCGCRQFPAATPGQPGSSPASCRA